MNTLVYTTAFGEAHFLELAGEMLRSLRIRGYEGDVALISDVPVRLPSDLRVRVLVLEPVDGPRLAKTRLASLMDTSKYDRVLFVDTDVVFLRHPRPLFEQAEARVAVSRDHYPLRRNTFNLSFCDRVQRSLLPADMRSVNTGVVAFPGARLVETLENWTRAWEQGLKEKGLESRSAGYAELRDQPAFQRMLLEAPESVGYLPDELVLMPLFLTEIEPLHGEAVVVHLNGNARSSLQKQRLLSLMRDFNALSEYSDFRRLCDALQARRPRASFLQSATRRPSENFSGTSFNHPETQRSFS